jgi:hemolysin activation/secretion protein
MQAGVDETGSSTVNVDVTGGTAWSVTAAANNGGYMGTGSLNLFNPFQLSKDGTNYQAMTSPFADFVTGPAGIDGSGTASVKQAIAASDAPGSYSITLTFTGSMA